VSDGRVQDRARPERPGAACVGGLRLLDERDRIAALLRHPVTPVPSGGLGPGDDAAVLVVPEGMSVVVSTDLVAEGTHFLPEADPHLVGRFVVTVNLSDLAAMGAWPFGFLVAYGVPGARDPEWMDRVGAGVAAALDAVDCPLIGGDTKEAAAPVLTGTALGLVPAGRAVTRRGASPGDVLVLTGPVGGPASVFEAYRGGRMDSDAAMEVLLGRTPRLEAGVRLREMGATAMVDLSDGFARAASLIAEASRVAVDIEADAVPLDPVVVAALKGTMEPWEAVPAWRDKILGFGGEYELLAAVPAGVVDETLKALIDVGLDAYIVGRCTEGEGATLRTEKGAVPLEALGWTHFS
jgi:thiamine-monophosphate kinase